MVSVPIFPFWVPRPLDAPRRRLSRNQANGNGAHRGYAELPYTLPQDSTLFRVLGERTGDIWLGKLDWIAKRGGMALLDIHPDYISFDGETSHPGEFPVSLYREFLEYAIKRYRKDFWNALPREVASWVNPGSGAILTANFNPAFRPPRRSLEVTIFGMGYVGCVTAAVLAGERHSVTGVELQAAKVALINSGKSPIIEPGLEDLISEGVNSGRLRAVERVDSIGDVSLVCVGTSQQ